MKAAFSMFTIVPMEVEGEDVMQLSKNFWIVTIVGMFLGVIAGLMMWLLTEPFSYFVTAVLVIFTLLSFNRFLHLDGLSDFGDGLLAIGDPERKRAIMKDSHVGAGGVGYALLFTLLSVAALTSLGGAPEMFLFFAPFMAETLGKCAMVTCAANGEAQEGMGGMFVKNTDARSNTIAVVLVSVILMALGLIFLPDQMQWGEMVLLVIAAVVASLFAGWYMAKLGVKHFGCVNGDILGATNEVARPIVLLVVLAVIWLFLYL